MKQALDRVLKLSVQKCFDTGSLQKTPLPEYVIEVPNNADHGHFATNLPLALASSQRRSPKDIAKTIVEHLNDQENFIEKAEIAGPGFINFVISRGEWYKVLSEILTLRDNYGKSRMGRGEEVLVEFVSANPTGPLHLGHGRGAALGDTLCRILSFTGHKIVREFYVNDAGQQIRLLGESIYGRWRQFSDPEFPFPENGYQGDYVRSLAKEISKEVDLATLQPEEAVSVCSDRGRHIMLTEIKQDLSDFRVDFDVWQNESDLFAAGLIESSQETLRKKGQIYEKDGALWIKTSLYGDDKDRVIRKGDGQYTYFASDISYHLEKWKRGFSKAVNIWGADHHGYVQRVKAALKTNDIDETWLTVLFIQLVKLWKGGEEIKMSKRAGHYVTLKELVEEVGVDAVRFVFLTKSHDSPLDFDIDLVKKHDSENPVYYVQYAHARICSVFRKASSEGITWQPPEDRRIDRLTLDEELALIRKLSEFPSLLEDISRSFEPHRLTYYLTELASQFHRYFNLGTRISENRIVCSDGPLTQERLSLAEAIRIVIHNGLGLLGIDAPEKM
jgi:arginyl-tRNA synthetase